MRALKNLSAGAMTVRAIHAVVMLAALLAGHANAQQPTTTTLNQPSSPVATTAAVQLTAFAVTSGSGGGTTAARSASRGATSLAGGGSDGTMSFREGTRLLGSVAAMISYSNGGSVVTAGGAITLPAGTFTPGTYSITAQYSGNVDLEPSTSTSKTLVVTAGGTVNYPPVPSSPMPVVDYEYDAVGHLTKVTQAKGTPGFGFATASTYDALGRRNTLTDAKTGLIEFGYDGQGGLVSVKDPRNLITQTPRDGHGNPLQLVSPDTGTKDMLHDAAGNLLAAVDSRGVLASRTYDAMNRPVSLVYSKPGSANLAYSWTYDQTGGSFFTYGVDKLTTATFPEGSTTYAYDAQGRTTQVRQTLNANASTNPLAAVLTTGYTYTTAGKLSSLTYPSGRKLTLTYSNGLPSGIGLAKDAGSAAVPLISNLQYAPFGAPERWDWAMNSGALAHVRVMDASGRLTRYRLGDHLRDITYDAAGRITAHTHYSVATGYAATAQDQQFGYDQLGRITQVTTALNTWVYTYDATGNRTSVALNSGAAAPYTIASTSNRLNAVSSPPISFSHDAAGNITSDGTFTLTYDLKGRLTSVTRPGQPTTSYAYDNDGQRVRKSSTMGSGSTVIFVYDRQGQLLGEYNSAGQAIREYVWLDNLPVAVFVPDPVFGSSVAPLVYYVHADHLNTPRVVVDRDNALRWRWMAEPFGTTPAETSPGGQAAFTYSLRFPGQFYDAESGAHYNMQRDYLPGVGRYAQSDPIGLAGGINTYGYVGGNPLSYVDPMGLLPGEIPPHESEPPLRDPSPLPILRGTLDEMDRKNVKGADQFFHCMATCRAVKAGYGKNLVRQYTDGKEYTDYARGRVGLYGDRRRRSHDEMAADVREDMRANEMGMSCPENMTCEQQCQALIQKVPADRRKFMREYMGK